MLQNRIRAGERDCEITFIKESTSRGSSNQDKINSWVRIDTDHSVFARKTEMKGNEIVVNDQLKFVQKTIFNVYFREDLTTKNRIAIGTKVYEIISITEPGETRRTSLDIVANFIDNETWIFT